MKRAWQVADLFRARGSKLVIGGIAATLTPREWTAPHADAIVLGEADPILALAAIVARELYGKTTPVVVAADPSLRTGKVTKVRASRETARIES